MNDAVPDHLHDDPDEVAFLRKLARVDDLPAPDSELRTGDRLARFSILERLGAGGMGAVYEAKDETLGRNVALKVMRRASDEARKRFIQEARAAAAVSHPNLIVVHEVGEADGRAFIVMELIRGRTLRAVMEGGVGRDESLRIIHEMLRGVAAAHAAGIVHRDLKPENVMIADDGGVKVLDFGIARLATDAGDAHAATALAVTGTGVVVGTPQYMSPEQALGIEVDARSDVYSFGVLAYELLTGKRPGPNPPPPKVPPAIDAVLVRCLSADPARRFAHAGEIRAALDGAPTRARRGPLIAIAALLVVALAGSLIAWRISRGAPAKPRPLVAAASVRAANADATAAYRAAFQQLRDAMFFEAVQSFEQAAKLDPMFAAAHLRLGLLKRFFHSADEARRSFAIAVANRAQLDDHDRTLLHATEPTVVRQPYDYAESRARLLAALQRFPGDAELLYYLGLSYSELGEHGRMLPLIDQLQAVDPTAAVWWSSRAIALLYLGDRRRAREAAIECRRVAPTQGGCAFELEKILNDMGSCSELETVLRAWQLASTDNPRVPRTLGRVLLGQARPLEAVRELFARSRGLMPEPVRAEALEEDTADIAWQTGDLDAYERVLRTWLARAWNPAVALALTVVLEETGRAAEARVIAEQYFAMAAPHQAGQGGTSDMDLYNDHTGEFLAVLARSGAISAAEFTERRDAWAQQLDRSIGGTFRDGIWAQVFAVPTRTADHATAAIEATQHSPPPFFWFTHVYGDVGRTLVLGGNAKDALPYLERATKRCLEPDPRDFYYLGLAHEQTGDATAACASFRTLLARWSGATTSVTVQHARARVAALRCE